MELLHFRKNSSLLYKIIKLQNTFILLLNLFIVLKYYTENYHVYLLFDLVGVYILSNISGIYHYEKYDFGRWAVIDKENDAFLGWCGLKFTPELAEYDIGFRFFKK